MTNNVPEFYKNYLMQLSGQNLPAYETVSAVCDLLVDDSYKMAKFERQNILIALEFSVKSLSNGTFMHALNSLESTLESLGEDSNLGICLFDSGVTFFDVDVDEEQIGNFKLIFYIIIILTIEIKFLLFYYLIKITLF